MAHFKSQAQLVQFAERPYYFSTRSLLAVHADLGYSWFSRIANPLPGFRFLLLSLAVHSERTRAKWQQRAGMPKQAPRR